jgi:phage-related minor tail protein
MTDIASLGLKVDSTQAASAAENLDKLTAAAGKAEGAADALANASSAANAATKATGDAAQTLATKQAATKQVMDGTTISVGQYKQALRQLPAQITDIVTGLTTGQSAFTVFIQQGGQIRDSFGGAGAALKAFTSFLNPTVLVIGAVAAVSAGLVAIFEKGQAEAFALQKAITLTGNAAGVTSGQLQLMADTISKSVGTHSEASAALASAASTNQIPAQLIQQVSQLAVQLDHVAGKAIEQTVSEFASLGDKPLEAVDALQKKYNFLTASVYDQVRALTAEGNIAQASQLAQSAFLDAMNQRTASLQANVGILEKLWNGVKTAVKGAGDAVLAIGRPSSPEQQLSDLRRQRGTRALGAVTSAPIDPFAAEAGITSIADQQRLNDALEISLAKVVDQRRKDAQAAADQAQQYKNYQANLIAANQAINAAIDENRQIASNQQQRLQNATQLVLQQIQVQDDALEDERNRNLISDQQYYAAKVQLITKSGQAQSDELVKEAALIRQQIATSNSLFDALRANASDPAESQQLALQQRSAQIQLEGQLADVEAKRKQPGPRHRPPNPADQRCRAAECAATHPFIR